MLPTLAVATKEDALSLEDKNDVPWVRSIRHARLTAQELIGFVDTLKHILQGPTNARL